MHQAEYRDEPKRRLISACQGLLQDSIRTARKAFGTSDLPTCSIEALTYAPSGPGRYAGSVLTSSELDLPVIRERIGDRLRATGSWEAAKASVQRYIDAHSIAAPVVFAHDVEHHYVWPLLASYLDEAKAFVYRRPLARKVIGELLRHLDSQDLEVTGLIALERFTAVRPFRLEPAISVRPIRDSELLTLGRVGSLVPPGLGGGQDPPKTDWWVCEVKLPNPRGTATGWNKVNDITEVLALELRAFKAGRMRLGHATTRLSSPFGGGALIRGGRLRYLAPGDGTYSLSEREVRQFTTFWRKFRPLMERPQHYLQVPIRRLLAGGSRAEQADALVDYVIGLEALLGTKDERTELGFRFRVRGSVLLSAKRTDRRARMRALNSLYDLRSRIVHGQPVRDEELEAVLPVADDALRRVWRWFFDHWSDRRDNTAGVNRIDELLVGA